MRSIIINSQKKISKKKIEIYKFLVLNYLRNNFSLKFKNIPHNSFYRNIDKFNKL